jgi:3-hydroxy-9,10-secoandrosta-1,3,5(10)-triene-9,17-dione monooxygenase reductase component
MDPDAAKAFRSALGAFATGVTIVTTNDGERDVGLTANSFNSVSLDPPLVLWSLARTSASLGAFQKAGHFAVNILATDQQELSNRFARPGTDKFADLELERGAGGVPLLVGCCARFQCRLTFEYEGGDHVIFVGEVVKFDHSPREPLLFHSGRYAFAAPPSEAAAEGLLLEAEDLSYLVQAAYFHLLTPVRQERERLGVSLSEHYVINVLMDGSRKRVSEINDIIAYTGLRATEELVLGLLGRGLVEADEAGEHFRLTRAGRSAAIQMLSAARAVEVEARMHFSSQESTLLKRLLRKIAAPESAADPNVVRHMELMRQISGLKDA